MSKPISNKNEKEIFARQMRELIPHGKMTEWAKKFGVSSESVSTYREGTIPRGDILLKISQETGKSMELLLTGKEVGPKLYENMELHDKVEDIVTNKINDIAGDFIQLVDVFHKRGVEMSDMNDEIKKLRKDFRRWETDDGNERKKGASVSSKTTKPPKRRTV